MTVERSTALRSLPLVQYPRMLATCAARNGIRGMEQYPYAEAPTRFDPVLQSGLRAGAALLQQGVGRGVQP